MNEMDDVVMMTDEQSMWFQRVNDCKRAKHAPYQQYTEALRQLKAAKRELERVSDGQAIGKTMVPTKSKPS